MSVTVSEPGMDSDALRSVDHHREEGKEPDVDHRLRDPQFDQAEHHQE